MFFANIGKNLRFSNECLRENLHYNVDERICRHYIRQGFFCTSGVIYHHKAFQMLPASEQLTIRSDRPLDEFIATLIQHERQLYHYIVTLLPNLNEADDILQETAVVLWRKYDEFQPGTNFYAWACRTAYLKVLEHRRNRPVMSTTLSSDVFEQLAVAQTNKKGEIDARLEALRDCLNKLRDKDRELLRRRYVCADDGMKMAADLGRPVNSIYQSLGRIRRTLMECIERRLVSEGAL